MLEVEKLTRFSIIRKIRVLTYLQTTVYTDMDMCKIIWEMINDSVVLYYLYNNVSIPEDISRRITTLENLKLLAMASHKCRLADYYCQ